VTTLNQLLDTMSKANTRDGRKRGVKNKPNYTEDIESEVDSPIKKSRGTIRQRPVRTPSSSPERPLITLNNVTSPSLSSGTTHEMMFDKLISHAESNSHTKTLIAQLHKMKQQYSAPAKDTEYEDNSLSQQMPKDGRDDKEDGGKQQEDNSTDGKEARKEVDEVTSDEDVGDDEDEPTLREVMKELKAHRNILNQIVSGKKEAAAAGKSPSLAVLEKKLAANSMGFKETWKSGIKKNEIRPGETIARILRSYHERTFYRQYTIGGGVSSKKSFKDEFPTVFDCLLSKVSEVHGVDPSITRKSIKYFLDNCTPRVAKKDQKRDETLDTVVLDSDNESGDKDSGDKDSGDKESGDKKTTAAKRKNLNEISEKLAAKAVTALPKQ